MTVELSAESFKVHASQKVQPEQYEPFETNVTVEGSVAHTGTLDNGTQRELKARLLALERDVQEAVERACENRIAYEQDEDWGVRDGDD